MRRWSIPALLLVLLSPLAAAQPEPEDVVEAACDLAPVDLPVCPPDDPAPAAPTPPAAEHAHDAPPAADDVATAVEDARAALDEAAEDPLSLPERAASLVAMLVQRVRDLLGLPLRALDAAQDAAGSARASLSALVDEARTSLAAWLGELRAPSATPSVRDAAAPLSRDAPHLLGDALQRVPSPIAR